MKNENYKTYNHYKISEIQIGNVVQLTLNVIKNKSYSEHFKIIKISNDGTYRIAGEGIFSTKGNRVFSSTQIERNYSIDPIQGEELDYKRKKAPAFKRSLTRKSQ